MHLGDTWPTEKQNNRCCNHSSINLLQKNHAYILMHRIICIWILFDTILFPQLRTLHALVCLKIAIDWQLLVSLHPWHRHRKQSVHNSKRKVGLSWTVGIEQIHKGNTHIIYSAKIKRKVSQSTWSGFVIRTGAVLRVPMRDKIMGTCSTCAGCICHFWKHTVL